MREKYSITVVNRTEDVEKRALKMAQDDLREEQHRPLGRNKWKPRTWMKKMALHFGEEYYRQRGKKRARKAILDTNNVNAYVDTIKDRVIYGYYNKAQSKTAGSAKIEQVHLPDQIQDKRFQQSLEVRGALKQLFVSEVLQPIVEGKILAEYSVQRKLRKFIKDHSKDSNKAVAQQVQELFGKKATNYGKMAEFFATDVKEVGEKIRQDIAENKYTLHDVSDQVDLTFANASWAAATKEQRTLTSRAITAAQKRPWARAVLNETSVGALTAATSFVLLRGTGRALSSLSMGAGAGALIGATERNKNLKHDMASHRVDAEYNQHWTDKAKRRGKLNHYTYTELASVNDLLDSDTTTRKTIGGETRSLQTLLALPDSDDARGALVSRIAEIQERLRFSAQKQAGFITYDEEGRVEQGRLALVKGIIRGKEKLVKGLITEGITLQQAETQVNQWVNESAQKWNELFTKDYKKQKRRFLGYRMRSSLAHGAIGGAIGFVSGALAQEATAGIMRATGEKVAPTVIEMPFVDKEEMAKEAIKEAAEQAREQMPAPQVKDIWTAQGTSLHHREWYAYNTPGSDCNELRFHTVKHGDSIDLVMKNMGWSSQSELKPPHLYVPGVEHVGQAAYAINLPGQEHNPVIAMADRTGRLHLDPTNHNPVDIVRFANGKTMPVGEFSQQILNPGVYASHPNGDIGTEPELRNVFAIGKHGNMGEISAGRVVERDGKAVWQSFATIFGSGEARRPQVTLPPLPHIEFKMPAEVPAIPIVVTTRKPLEAQSQR